MSPDADDFAALARSSPWRWSTLRFTVRWTGEWPTWPEPLRAWLRRPDALRVETVGGALVQVVHERPQQVGVLGVGGGYTRTLPWWTEAPPAPRRDDGLVAARPDRFGSDFSFDAPMFQNYRWVAMLDPVELADGLDRDTAARPPGTTVDNVTEVQHSGRPAWEALLRVTDAYEPRCSCCPLLRARRLDVLEFGADSERIGEPDAYPTAHRVRLDVGTGVCVYTEEVGGAWSGAGHDLRIEAVDEPMDDGLFVSLPQRRPGRWWPGRRQYPGLS